jgi:hypothetical protein
LIYTEYRYTCRFWQFANKKPTYPMLVSQASPMRKPGKKKNDFVTSPAAPGQ